jgi:hypothetical protein
MYHQESLQTFADIQKTTIETILNQYKGSILYVPQPDNINLGHVIKDTEISDIKVMDIIKTRRPDIIQVGKNKVGIVTDLLNTTRIVIPKPKKKETKKELNGKNILTAMKIASEIMEADYEMAMDQLMAINEKVKVAAKLKELGYETKKQRKEVHMAIKYHKSKIKDLGVNGAAEDTAEKYRFPPDFIKKIVGFQNKQKQNRFK